MSDDDPAPRRREWTVAGRVQGVGFRAATRREALRLGLHGRAINLDDGRVHVLATGDIEALDALERWLRRGPPRAHVVQLCRVSESDRSCDPSLDHDGFDTR